MRTRPVMGTVAIAVLASLLVGCTGDGDAGGTAATGAVTPSSSTTGSPEVPAPTTSGPTTSAPTTSTPTTSTPTTSGPTTSAPSTSRPTPPAGPAPTGRPTVATALPDVVTVTGTVEAGVETGCVLLDGLLLIGGSPQVLQPGTRVTVTGRIDPTMRTTCQQGIPMIVMSAEEA